MLTEEQASAIKQQLIEHIETSFPEDKRQFAKEQIHRMDAESLEEFLKKNNLVAGQNSQCIFCSIISGEIPSYKIDENDESIVVLEINPISKGHVLIIPKKHSKEKIEEEVSEEIQNLAKKISQKIKTKLKPKRVDIILSSAFGHSVTNIIPIYTDESISSKRQSAKKEELEEVQNLLKEEAKDKIPKPKIEKTSKPKTSREKKSLLKKAEEVIEKFEKKLWLPKRIP
jgi:histidine triad (HIT) family protein